MSGRYEPSVRSRPAPASAAAVEEDHPELQALIALEEAVHVARRNLAFAAARRTRLQAEVRALAGLADQLWRRATLEIQNLSARAARPPGEDAPSSMATSTEAQLPR